MKTLKVQKGKLLFTAMILCAVLFVWNQAGLKAHAYIQTEGTVTAESENIRKEADASSTAIASVKKGDTLTINNEVTGADGKVWYYVYVDNSTMGYILADLVDKKGGNSNGGSTLSPDDNTDNTTDTNTNEPENPPAEPDTPDTNPPAADGVTAVTNVSATVTGSTVNVRKDADESSSVVSKVQKEMVVTITGQKEAADGKMWYQVFFTSNASEVTGFIRSDFLKPDGEILPVQDEPDAEPPAEVPDEPAEQPKDYDTVYKGNAEGTPTWYLVNQLTGEEYGVTELIQAKKDNETLLKQAQKEVKSQKTTIVILVLILLLFVAGIVFLLIKCKDTLLEEVLGGGRPEPNRGRRPSSYGNGQRRPAPGSRGNARPQGGTRPQGSRPQGGARPQGSTGSQGAARPQGSGRPQGATRPQGTARPQGSGRPQGAARPQGSGRPQGAARPQGTGRPQGAARPQGTGAPQGTARPQNSAGAGNSVMPQADGISRRTQQSVEERKMQSMSQDTQQKWKSKNFMNDDDEFEFEFLNWDGVEDKS